MHRWGYRRESVPNDLDFPVDAVDHLEAAFVGFVVVAGDHPVFAFGENHAGKCPDRLLDHIAPRREHRPLRVGARFPAPFIH